MNADFPNEQPYQAPTVEILGSVAELTRSNAGGNNDSLSQANGDTVST